MSVSATRPIPPFKEPALSPSINSGQALTMGAHCLRNNWGDVGGRFPFKEPALSPSINSFDKLRTGPGQAQTKCT
jgi:hypothetical protein